MADELNAQDMKQSQRISTASKAILAVVAVTTVSSVAISKYNSASSNTNTDTASGGSTHHMLTNSPQEVSSDTHSNKAMQITQTIQQLNQVSNSLSKESIDIFNTLYNEQAERSSSRRRLSMSENEGKLLRGLSTKQSTPDDDDNSNIQKISLSDITKSQQNRKLGRGVGMKRPKGHNMLQNMDNKWHSGSSSNSHSEDANMLQRYSSPSWDTWYSDMDADWNNMNTEWGSGGKSGKSGHWEYHPIHEKYWDHPSPQKQWGQPPSWNMNEWGGGGKSGKSGQQYQGWGHEVPVVGWDHPPSNWWGYSSSSSDDNEDDDTTYSTSEVNSETDEVDVTFSASSVEEDPVDDRNGEPKEEAAASSEEGEDGIVISYGYCGIDAEEASRRCKKPCTSSSDCKEDKQCFASPSCDPDAAAAAAAAGGKMNRNGDQFEELDRQVEFGQMDADGNMVEVAADADESSTSFTSSAMVEEEDTFFSASSVQEEGPMYSSSSAFANAHYQVSSPQEDYESHHSGWSQGYYQEEESGWEGGSTEMVECHPVEEVMWSGGRKLYGKASQGWWSQPPPPPSWHQQPSWMGGSKTSKTASGYGFYPSSSNDNYGGTKAGKAAWGSSQWHQPPPAWSHGPPNPEHHAPVIDHAPQYHQDSSPQNHPHPVSWNYDPWAKSSKAKSGKTKSGKSCYILVQEPRSSDDFGPSYCGMSFADASNQCSQRCASDGDCSGGASCFGPITSCGGGPFPPSPTPPSPPSGVGYCGMSFADASSTCSQQCSSSGDCSAGFNCYGPITSCGGSPPPPPTPPILPPVVSGYCGMSGGDALNQCSRRCTTSADCSGGAQCFSAPGCLVSNGVCGTSQQDASDSCEPSCIDNTDCSGGEQCFPVDISGCGGVISNGFCGSNVGNANEQCKVKCTTDADCSGGGQCFSAPGCLVSNGVCGSSFLDAINKCEPTCTSSADCSGSDQCFSVPKDACPSYCGTSFADAESQCAVKCTKNSDCSGGAKCQGPIPNCTPDVDPPEPAYCPEGCPDCDPNSPLPCPRVSMKQVCDKHNDELYPPGDPKAGQRIANFNDCYDMCKPSFCCIHDSTSEVLSPTCAGNIGPNKYENCPLYYPCYIIWWKLHDTIGPATYLRVEGSEEPFFENLNFDTIRQDFIQDKVFFNQLYNHHFDTDDIPTDDTFEDPNNW